MEWEELTPEHVGALGAALANAISQTDRALEKYQNATSARGRTSYLRQLRRRTVLVEIVDAISKEAQRVHFQGVETSQEDVTEALNQLVTGRVQEKPAE